MKRSTMTFWVALLFIGWVPLANATPMVATISGTISVKAGTQATADWNIGDTISISFYYDNEGTEMHNYQDGSNLIGELGGGDDTIDYLFTLPPTYYSFYSDAEVELDPKVATYATNYTKWETNWARVTANIDGGFSFQYWRDGLNTGYQYRPDIDSSTFWLDWYDQNDQFNAVNFSDVVFSNAEIGSSDPVPEPTTMFLFGTGLVGLCSSRIRRKR